MKKMFTKLFGLALLMCLLCAVVEVSAQCDVVLTASDVELVTDPAEVCDTAYVTYQVVGFSNAEYAFNLDNDSLGFGGFTQDSTISVKEGVAFRVMVRVNDTCYSNELHYTDVDLIEPVVIDTAEVEHPLCYGEDGEVTIVFTGYHPPYTYYFVPEADWVGPQDYPSKIVGSAHIAAGSGKYYVAVQDANNCVDITSIAAWDSAVVNPAPPMLVVDTIYGSDPECIGGDGTVTVIASGGTPYSDGSYSITVGGVTIMNDTAVFDLPAGEYWATVQDSNMCEIVSDSSAVLTDPDSIMFEITLDDIACSDSTDGAIYIYNITGPADSSMTGYLAFFGADTMLAMGTPVNDTIAFTGLKVGYYSVWVGNDNDACDSVGYVNPNGTGNVISLQAPGPIDLVLDVDTAVCYGDSSIIMASATGGSGNFEYQLEDGSSGVLDAWGVTSTWTVEAGTYVVVVRDADVASCEVYGDAPIVLTDAAGVTITGVDPISPTCPGGNDGAIQVTATTEPGRNLMYSLNGINWYPNNILTVAAGDYTVYVKDDVCDSIAMMDVTVWPLDTNRIRLGAATDTINECFDVNDNQIVVRKDSWASQAGEFRRLTVMITDNIDSVYVSGEEMFHVPGQPHHTKGVENVDPGTYYIWAVDDWGCVFDGDLDGTADYLTVTITEADPLTVSGTVTEEASCFESYDGVMTIMTSDSVHYIGRANTMQAAMNLQLGAMTYFPDGTDSVSMQVGKGTYYLVAVNDCDVRAISEPLTVGGLDEVTIEDTAMSVTHIVCYGDTTGMIEVFPAEGGNEDFDYTLQMWDGGAWVDVAGYVNVTETMFENLGAGDYKVVVTDLGGCEGAETGTITIWGPDSPVIIDYFDFEDITCYNASDGLIMIEADGGTPPYQFKVGTTNWRDFPTGSDEKTIVATDPGMFIVWVRDSLGCVSAPDTAWIYEPDSITLVVEKTDVTNSCTANNGELDIDVSGGHDPALWNIYIPGVDTFSTTGVLNVPGLTAGSYTVIAEEDGGTMCRKEKTVEITSPDTLSAMATVLDSVACFGGGGGEIMVQVSGGTPGYRVYMVGETDTLRGDSVVFMDLMAGTYTIEVQDTNNCPYTLGAIEITQADSLTLAATWISDITCMDHGKFSVQAGGGSGEFMYYAAKSKLPQHILVPDPMTSDAWQTDSVFMVDTAATYIVWAYDIMNGCLVGGEEYPNGQPANSWRVKIAEPDIVVTVNAEVSGEPDCNGDMGESIMVPEDSVVITLNGVPLVDPVYTVMIDTVATDTLSGIGAGTYVVTVTHTSSGCSGTDTVVIDEPDVLEAMLDKGEGEFTCPEVVEGYLEATGMGGTEPYMYSLWWDGHIKTDYQAENSFLVKIGHSYFVKIKDANDCIMTSDTMALDSVQEIMFEISDVTCSSDTLASVMVDVTGEPGRMFQVSWRQFEDDSPANPDTSEWFSESIKLDQRFIFDNENVKDIHYEFTVVDDMGCVSGIDTMTFDQIITSPLEFSVTEGQSDECSTEYTISASGGVAPYMFTVDDTVMVEAGTITLSRGTHVVAAMDAHTCTMEETVEVMGEYVTRDTMIETYIGEETIFMDEESGVEDTLTVGMYQYMYMFGDCERTLNVEVVEVPRPYTIAEIQGDSTESPIQGEIAQIMGTVTGVASGEGFFVQDASAAWSGIWVEYTDADSVEVGDAVTVVGEVAEVADVTTILATDVMMEGTPMDIMPVEVTPSDAQAEMYESVLVTVPGARAMAADTTTGQWMIYYEPTDDITVNDWLYSSTPVEGDFYNVTGVVNGRLDAFNLEPRMESDVVDVTETPNKPVYGSNTFKVYPNPFNDKIYIDNNDKLTRVVVINIAGQRVIDIKYPEREIRTANLVSGVYLVNLFTESGLAKTERIVKR